MQSQIRNNIAGLLNAAFPLSLHLHHLTLDPWPRNQGILTSMCHPGRSRPFAYISGETLGSPLWQETQHHTGIQKNVLGFAEE